MILLFISVHIVRYGKLFALKNSCFSQRTLFVYFCFGTYYALLGLFYCCPLKVEAKVNPLNAESSLIM